MSLSTHIESKAICSLAGKPGKHPCAKSDLPLRTSPASLHSSPSPATRGCHPPPETVPPLKGKPETGMDAADIYPKLTIRFPNAAPFDCWISLFHQASEPPGLLCVPRVPV